MVDSVNKSLPSGLRILLTNNQLGERAGSEMFVRDLAIALMKRGHFPVAYSPVLGKVAQELAQATIPVIDDLRALNEPPDIIHGQHHLETMTAVLRFPGTPTISACHGWMPWEERPPVFPTIMRYVAVDELCRERLLTTPGVPADSIGVIYNFVDLERFRQRTEWRKKPVSALIFSNYAGNDPRTQTIKAACARFGIERVDVAGVGSGNSIANPEDVLGGYDVIFGKARCALEAMACGAAVIVADHAGLGGLVTTANMKRMRPLNFGARTMQAAAITEESVVGELQLYDPEEARRVSVWIRAEADMSAAVTAWLSLYADALSLWRDRCGSGATIAHDEHSAAASAYLRWLAPMIKSRSEADYNLHHTTLARADLEQRLGAREAELAAQSHQAASVQAELTARLAHLEARLHAIESSRMWRVVAGYGRLKAWFHRT